MKEKPSAEGAPKHLGLDFTAFDRIEYTHVQFFTNG